MNPNPESCLIQKKILYPGRVFKPLKDDCKVYFHFQTRKTDDDSTLIDDSRVMGKKEPMVLVIGKKFKFEPWEVMVKKMAVDEVAKFTVDKSLTMQYPFVSKTLRELNIDKSEKKTHMCAMTLQNDGIGYNDLNELLKKPCDLEFTIELLKVEYPEEYQKDSWLLSNEEKLSMIPALREKGNNLFNSKMYKEAAEAYGEAICYCENLMNMEKPHDDDWNNLNKMKMPLLLNFSQCKLIEGDYYAVIEHCSTVLQSDPDNVKALYRRAKAYVKAWDPPAAIEDFNRVKELDPTLTTKVNSDLKELEALQKEHDQEDKVKLKKLFA